MNNFQLCLMWITNSPELAKAALGAGADRVFIDLETIGKEIRQANTSSHLAQHSANDVKNIRSVLPKAEILVRSNPLHRGSAVEIESILLGRPDFLMLPMFRTVEEVCKFEALIDGRAKISLLLETPQALVRLPDILAKMENVAEVHVGLNDLHLAMGLDFMFEPLAGGLIDIVAQVANDFGVRFGFGGIARMGEGQVTSDLILSEHVRLGSQMVILSRAFRGDAQTAHELQNKMDLPMEIQKVRERENELRSMDESVLMENSKLLRQLIFEEAQRRH